MATGSEIVALASKHVGEAYLNTTPAPKSDPTYKGPWDCAEFASWLVFQVSGRLYGCDNNAGDPAKADAYTGFWKRDARALGKMVPVEVAAATPGAMLLRYPPGQGKMGHIAVSNGEGGTVEAKGRKYGVVEDTVQGRRWDTGVLVPWIDYDDAGVAIDIARPAEIYAPDAPNMSPAVVRAIQEALKARGFDPGPVDGEYGEATAAAVAAFQDRQGVVPDGEVGGVTAAELGISLVGAVAQTVAVATAPMLSPLIAVATAVFPDLVRVLAGDPRGTLAAKVADTVADTTGTSNPDRARERLAADPAAATQLQVRLAELSLEETKREQQREVAARRAATEAEQKRQAAFLETMKLQAEESRNARSAALDYVKVGGPMAWGAPLVSAVVTIGFFVILGVLLSLGKAGAEINERIFQILNLAVGSLIAGFATVISFWLGSSQGSRIKDVATIDAEQSRTRIEAARPTEIRVEVPAPPPAAARTQPPQPAERLSNFKRCIDIVLGQEGGFSNHKRDKGGATQFGISTPVLEEWWDKKNLTPEDVAKLTLKEACEIYRTRYWNVLRCDDLPVGVDLVVFDFGVNAGPGRSAKMLQDVVGAEADGSVGPATVAATKAADPRTVVSSLSQKRLAYYRTLGDWDVFGEGWTNRTNTIEKAALAMMASPS